MHWRLAHVLIAMTLILLAGLLGVRSLEDRAGATTVAGCIVVDAPTLDGEALAALAGRWAGGQLGRVAAPAGALQPFSPEVVGRWTEAGARSVLLSLVPLADPGAARRAWRVLIEGLPFGEGPPAGARRLSSFIAEQHGTRPFLVGFALGELPAGEVPALVEPLLDTAAALPSFRRTSLLVLGGSVPGSAERMVLRIDRGRWHDLARPALADLLETSP